MSSHSLSVPLRTSLKTSSDVAQSSAKKPALTPPDNDLMVLVQNGDHEAFGQLFDRYYVTVRSVARKFLKNPEDVADIIQEAFLDLYENARSFDPSRGTLKTWISYLTYHRSLKRLQLLKRPDWQSGDSDEALSILDSSVTPDGWIRSLDFRKAVDAVLGSLNERQRQTMELYFFKGLELSVIATQIDETMGNTRHHLYRGLARLRSELVQNRLVEGYLEFASGRKKE